MPLGASRGSLGHTMDPKAINHFVKKLEPKEFAGPEVGLADGAYTGNYRLVTPFRKPPNKSMPARKNVNTLTTKSTLFFAARIFQASYYVDMIPAIHSPSFLYI